MDRVKELVTVFGGAGFVGTQVVQLLAQQGHRIRVAVRRPDLAGHLRPLGAVGQIALIQANVRDQTSVEHAVRGATIVINLVGIGAERGKQNFSAIHVAGARHVAGAAATAGAKRLLHMSILGADANAAAAIARSRGEGEAEVFAAYPEAIVMRPSLIFGPGDSFFNLLGTLARLAPVLPLIGGRAKAQPVYVKDVAAAFLAAAEGSLAGGRVYELGGPDVETQRQLIERVLRDTGRSNPLLPVGPGLAKLLVAPLGLLPRPLVTAHQVDMLGTDNIVSDAAVRDGRTLAGIGIAATAMDAILPAYLWRFRKHGQFDRQTA